MTFRSTHKWGLFRLEPKVLRLLDWKDHELEDDYILYKGENFDPKQKRKNERDFIPQAIDVFP